MSGESRQPLIRLKGISKVYETDDIQTYALAGVDLEVQQGDFMSISGPSGCGKSTLLTILGLLDPATEGDYWLNDTLVSKLSAGQRVYLRNREIGFIFQAFNLISDLTAYENVELPLTCRSLSAAEMKQRVHEALERVGMGHRAKHYPTQLSGGQQQRIAVARALVGRPSVLLADEPTGNLDSKNGVAVMELLRELHEQGATICMVTHDTRFTRYAERTVQLLDGKILEPEAAKAEDPAATLPG